MGCLKLHILEEQYNKADLKIVHIKKGLSSKNIVNNARSREEYLYNGKEMQDDHGLEWLDYGARFYSPVLARWSSIDPQASRYNSVSPYAYVANNPIKFIDPNGEEIWIYYTEEQEKKYKRGKRKGQVKRKRNGKPKTRKVIKKFKYEVGKSFESYGIGDNKFAEMSVDALNSLNEMYSDLGYSNSENIISKIAADDDKFVHLKEYKHSQMSGRGNNLYVRWNPTRTFIMNNVSWQNTYERPSIFGLLHELHHVDGRITLKDLYANAQTKTEKRYYAKLIGWQIRNRKGIEEERVTLQESMLSKRLGFGWRDRYNSWVDFYDNAKHFYDINVK